MLTYKHFIPFFGPHRLYNFFLLLHICGHFRQLDGSIEYSVTRSGICGAIWQGETWNELVTQFPAKKISLCEWTASF